MNGELPFISIWVNEFLAETARCDALQTGAYAYLLFEQWESGSLPADHADLAHIAKCTPEQFESVWRAVGRRFSSVEGQPDRIAHTEYAKRRDEALAKKAAASAKAREKAETRWKRTGDAPPDPPKEEPQQSPEDATAMPQHSPGTAGAEPQQSQGNASSASASASAPDGVPPSPNGDLPPEGASAVKSAEPEKPKKAGVGGGKRVAPEEPPLATLPAELEPFAKMLIAFLAKRNADGRISTGRIATVRQKLAETLETVEGQWRYVAFGVQEAVSRDATDERYAITVAKRTFQRGSIPEWAQADIAKHVPDAPKARPRPPADFNTWTEPKKDAWLRENGYV